MSGRLQACFGLFVTRRNLQETYFDDHWILSYKFCGFLLTWHFTLHVLTGKSLKLQTWFFSLEHQESLLMSRLFFPYSQSRLWLVVVRKGQKTHKNKVVCFFPSFLKPYKIGSCGENWTSYSLKFLIMNWKAWTFISFSDKAFLRAVPIISYASFHIKSFEEWEAGTLHLLAYIALPQKILFKVRQLSRVTVKLNYRSPQEADK